MDHSKQVTVDFSLKISNLSTEAGSPEAISQEAGYYLIPNDKYGSYTCYRRKASSFVYPDGSFGSAGIIKYFHPPIINPGHFRNYQPKAELLPWLKDGLLVTRSAKMAQAIQLLNQSDGKSLIFIVFFQGIVLLPLALQAHGYKEFVADNVPNEENYDNLANILEMKPRYVIIWANTTNYELNNIMKILNHPDNRYGQYIKAIITTKARVANEELRCQFRDILQIQELDSSFEKELYDGAVASSVWPGIHDYILSDDVPTPLTIKAYRHAAVSSGGDSADLEIYNWAEHLD